MRQPPLMAIESGSSLFDRVVGELRHGNPRARISLVVDSDRARRQFGHRRLTLAPYAGEASRGPPHACALRRRRQTSVTSSRLSDAAPIRGWIGANRLRAPLVPRA